MLHTAPPELSTCLLRAPEQVFAVAILFRGLVLREADTIKLQTILRDRHNSEFLPLFLSDELQFLQLFRTQIQDFLPRW